MTIKSGESEASMLRVNRINSFAARNELAYLAINFSGRRVRIHARANQRRLLRRFRRKIALMRHPGDGIAKSERVENFRC